MPSQDLQNYIQQSRQAGKTDDIIRQELLNVGWQARDVEEAMGDGVFPNNQPSNTGPVKTLNLSKFDKLNRFLLILIGIRLFVYAFQFLIYPLTVSSDYSFYRLSSFLFRYALSLSWLLTFLLIRKKSKNGYILAIFFVPVFVFLNPLEWFNSDSLGLYLTPVYLLTGVIIFVLSIICLRQFSKTRNAFASVNK